MHLVAFCRKARRTTASTTTRPSRSTPRKRENYPAVFKIASKSAHLKSQVFEVRWAPQGQRGGGGSTTTRPSRSTPRKRENYPAVFKIASKSAHLKSQVFEVRWAPQGQRGGGAPRCVLCGDRMVTPAGLNPIELASCPFLGSRYDWLKICMDWVGDKPRGRKYSRCLRPHRDGLRLVALELKRRRKFGHLDGELTWRATGLP